MFALDANIFVRDVGSKNDGYILELSGRCLAVLFVLVSVL